MAQKLKFSTQQIILIALFTAIVYAGIKLFQFPLGTEFIHFGNIFFMLAVISLGPVPGTISGVAGFVIFDLTSGYVAGIPKIIILSIVKGFVCGYLYGALYHKIGERNSIIVSTFLGFLTYPILNTLWKTIEFVLLGSDAKAAFISALTAQFSSVINMVIGTILVPIFYELVFKRAFKAAHIPLYRH